MVWGLNLHCAYYSSNIRYNMKYLALFFCSFLSIALGAQNVIIEDDYVEATFNKKTTKQELSVIQKQLADEGIDIDFMQLEFNKRKKLRAINFKVDCNNGNSGSASSAKLGLAPIGFFCDKRPGATPSFSIGSMRKKHKS